MTAEPPSPMGREAPPARMREVQDPLNAHVFHPLARGLARTLRQTFVTPNQVSVAGGLCIVGAGVAYAQPGWPFWTLAGFVLHLSWHVLDGADGDLARMTGRSSPFGEFVDGICDYAGHVVLYLMLGWLLSQQLGGWAWCWAVLAGASRILQQNHYECNHRQYKWWVAADPWLIQSSRQAEMTSPVIAAAHWYLGLSRKIAMRSDAIEGALARTRGNAPALDTVRSRLRRQLVPFLQRQRLLGANPRTIALGLSMLVAGTPLWFFLFEIIPLNLLFGASMLRQARVIRSVESDLAQP